MTRTPTTRMTKRSTTAALLTLAAFLACGGIAMAENKIVTTKEGQSYEGEVTQSGDRVTITPKSGAKVTLFKANVASIEAAPTVDSQFRDRLAKLQKNDAKGRVELANWAVKKNELGLAMEALDGAIAIDPNYEEAIQLRSTLAKARKAASATSTRNAQAGAGTPAKAPGTAAAADPAAPADPAATTPARDAAPKKSHTPPKTRLVTGEEINQIRQLELQKDDAVTIRLQNGVKQRYISSTSDVSPQAFNKLTPSEQGMEILRHGSAKLHNDVVIATDPATMSLFKSNVQRNVLVGCAAASCHGRGPTGVGGDKAGDFVLHNPADKAPELYTNFLLMQGYKTSVAGKDRSMIDRARPENSLVLQYGLAQRDADIPHPDAQNFRPMFKGKNDPKYKLIADWVGKTLAPIAPEYNIDLTKEPPESSKPAKPGAERPAP